MMLTQITVFPQTSRLEKPQHEYICVHPSGIKKRGLEPYDDHEERLQRVKRAILENPTNFAVQYKLVVEKNTCVICSS